MTVQKTSHQGLWAAYSTGRNSLSYFPTKTTCSCFQLCKKNPNPMKGHQRDESKLKKQVNVYHHCTISAWANVSLGLTDHFTWNVLTMKEANVALGRTFVYIPAWRQKKTLVDKASVLDTQKDKNNKPDFLFFFFLRITGNWAENKTVTGVNIYKFWLFNFKLYLKSQPMWLTNRRQRFSLNTLQKHPPET